MTISISSRVRNAMVGLALGLSLLFTALIFLLAYVIEDKVFVNQIQVEQAAFEQVILGANLQKIQDWQPRNANIQRIDTADDLPQSLSPSALTTIRENLGVHEYFDDDNAVFIASLDHPNSNASYYLVYDVKGLLVVRNTKGALFALIGLLTLIIAIISIIFARRLSTATLAPISRLSRALQDNDLDHMVIDLAQEFSEDEIGILARELAQALERIRAASQREYEFNRGVSHELRSPIQVAQSAIELLELQVSVDDRKIGKPVSRLQRSVAEMNEIAEAFLWLASDRIVARNEHCSITSVQHTLCAVQAALPNHEIVVKTGSAQPLHYPMPSSVLSVVVRNLVRNAAIHGDPSPIYIDLSMERITVRNTTNPGLHGNRGFGMGLSIVQRICDRFACTLSVELKHENQYFSSVVFT